MFFPNNRKRRKLELNIFFVLLGHRLKFSLDAPSREFGNRSAMAAVWRDTSDREQPVRFDDVVHVSITDVNKRDRVFPRPASLMFICPVSRPETISSSCFVVLRPNREGQRRAKIVRYLLRKINRWCARRPKRLRHRRAPRNNNKRRS